MERLLSGIDGAAFDAIGALVEQIQRGIESCIVGWQSNETSNHQARAPAPDATINKPRGWLMALAQEKLSVNLPHMIDAAIKHDSVTGATKYQFDVFVRITPNTGAILDHWCWPTALPHR